MRRQLTKHKEKLKTKKQQRKGRLYPLGNKQISHQRELSLQEQGKALPAAKSSWKVAGQRLLGSRRIPSVPPEVPDWRAAGAGFSSAAFQSSLGTPPVCRRAVVVRGGRREHAGPAHCSAQRARPCKAYWLQTLCGPAGAPGLRGAAAAPHRGAAAGQSSTAKAWGALLPLSLPPPLAGRRSAEGRGLLYTDAHLRTVQPRDALQGGVRPLLRNAEPGADLVVVVFT
ncbi:hypothetical protein NN561_007704 [Cricetulus griseus]